MLVPDIVRVEHLQDFRLRLTFANGVVGDVDLRDHIMGQGGVFQPLEDPNYFVQVRVNNDIGTIVWPNDADLSPDFLYELVTGHGTRTLRSTG